MKKIYTLILAAAVLLYSCKSASKAFEKGDYEDAVSIAVKKLQKNGNDAATQSLLRDAYQRAVDGHEAVIRNLSNSASENRFEQIYYEYRKLQNLYESIARSPEASRVVKASDYSSYVQAYKEKAGQVYFDRGLALMQKGDKASFRQAYNELKTAYRFRNDYEVKRKMEEAYEGAVVRVLLLTDNNVYSNGYGAGGYYGNGGYRGDRFGNGYNDYNTSYEIRNFQQNLVRNLRYQSNNEFVQFISDADVRGSVQPDEIIEMNLGRLDMGRSYDENNYRDVSKQIVTRTIVYKPDSVVNEYGTVYARINVTRRNFVSYGDLHITARDAAGKYLWGDVIGAEHRFSTEFASYTGDERALSASDRALISNSQNNGYNNIRREDIYRELLRQLENEASSRFRNYYSRFY